MSVFAGQYLSEKEKEKEWKDMKTRSIINDTVRLSVCLSFHIILFVD